MKKLTTISDIGSVKIGIDGQFTLDVPNGYGDESDTTVIICDKNECAPEDYALWASVRGNNINIYDYDCGGEVIETLSGRYGIYVAGDRGEFPNEGAVIFEKWEDNEGTVIFKKRED